MQHKDHILFQFHSFSNAHRTPCNNTTSTGSRLQIPCTSFHYFTVTNLWGTSPEHVSPQARQIKSVGETGQVEVHLLKHENMCMRTHTHTHTHMRAHTHTHSHTHACTHIHTHTDVMSSNDTTHSGKFSSLQDGRHLYHSSGKPIIHVMHSTPYQKLLQRHLRKTVQYILVLGKSNTRSTPSLWSLPRVAFETVSGFWCHKHPMTNLMVPEYAGMAGCTSQKSNYIIFPLHYRRVTWIGLL